jgi:hypothetical protein
VRLYVLKAWLRNHLHELPVPIRLSLAYTIIAFVMITMVQDARTWPPIGVPLLNAGAFCLALTVVMLMPRRKPVRAHWVGR